MYSHEQSMYLIPPGWPEPPLMQMGQLGMGPERQAADQLDQSDLYRGDHHGIEREVQFADAVLPEVQALG